MHIYWTGVIVAVLTVTCVIQSLLSDRVHDNEPKYIGYTAVVPLRTREVLPALKKLPEYRTSQLVHVHGGIHKSRRVLYLSTYKSALKVVVLVPLDADSPMEELVRILDERRQYAEHHGYGLFARYIQDFATEYLPATEALRLAHVRMLRQAMVTFPQATWFWYLQGCGRILNHHIAMDQILQKRLQSEMLRAVPIRPSEGEGSALTSRANRASDVSIVIGLASQGLAASSYVVRSSFVSIALLELMLDPINQEYPDFLNDTDHAGALLTHLAEWHPFIMAKMAVVPPHMLGSGTTCTRGDLACTFESPAEWGEFDDFLITRTF